MPSAKCGVRRVTRSCRSGLLRRFLRNPLGLIATTVLLAVIIIAVVVPFLGLPDPNVVSRLKDMYESEES